MPLPALFRALFIPLAVLCSMPLWADSDELQPGARQPLTWLKVPISEQERTWLKNKQTLVVGVTQDSLPPYRIFTEHQGFEGITADYLVAMQRELGVAFKVRRFSSSKDAFEALRKGQVDLVGNATLQEARDFAVHLSPLTRSPNWPCSRKGAIFTNTAPMILKPGSPSPMTRHSVCSDKMAAKASSFAMLRRWRRWLRC
ncbi:transporter substrate-binding domain-containing protein [Pseudomonas vranovensis]|uniref:transporter substrate-binding domain-containing protein n=1 Tax=Pseudomonas vranovensis TaxID=321661 RepID=UPI003D98A651